MAVSTTKIQAETKRQAILTIIGLFIMFGFGFLPPIAPITELGMRVLGVFIGTIFLWSTVDLLWPSILALLAFALVGYDKLSNILAISLGNDTVWICVLAMAILGVLEKARVMDHVITFLLTRKICQGRPWAFTVIWFITGMLLVVLVGNPIIVTLTLWSILISLSKRVGFQPGDKWVHLMIIGTAVVDSASSNLLPFIGLPLWLFGSVRSITGQSVNVLHYVAVSIPLVFCYIAAMVFLMRFVFRADVSKLSNLDMDYFRKDLPPMNKLQKFLLGYFFFYILFLAIPSMVPKTSWIGMKWSAIGIVGGIMFIFIILCVIKVNGKTLMPFNELASSSIRWNIVFLISVAVSLSTILMDESTGIREGLLLALTPVFNGLHPLVFIAVFMLIAVILTNIGNNIVVALILAPIAATFSTMYPINIMGTIALLSFAVNIAFILPSASPTSAMIFGHEWIDKKRHWLFTLTICPTLLIVLVCIGYPLSNFFLK